MTEEFQVDPVLEAEFQRQLKILTFGTAEITPYPEFEKMLRQAVYTHTPLRVKCGIDPTGSDIHLGHLVPFRKMRQFQDLGHTGVVVVGDFTASIGDPSGKNESRPALSLEQVKKNAEKYMEQLYTVLDKEKTEIRFQTEWYNGVGLKDVIAWAAETTVAKLMGHETFRKRLDEGSPLSLHEMFYPVLQGMDSVYIKADVELGGTDQKFNVLMGRDYQKNRGMRPQVAMNVPIIKGICGHAKMSKSLNNYIGIFDKPSDKFGKIMSIPDSLILEYYKHLANVSPEKYEEIEAKLKDPSFNPSIAKKELGESIVKFFHGAEAAAQARAEFENVFSKKGIPDVIPEFQLTREMDILTLLVEAKLAPTRSEARRLVQQGGVSIVDGDKITSTDYQVTGELVNTILKVGKRKFVRLF